MVGFFCETPPVTKGHYTVNELHLFLLGKKQWKYSIAVFTQGIQFGFMQKLNESMQTYPGKYLLDTTSPKLH